MKKIVVFALCLMAFSFQAAADDLKFGFVDPKTCIEKSKLGLQEKNNMEAMKKQMTESLEKSDKELADLEKKLTDQDYIDTLSPQAEQELQARFQTLGQEFQRNQNQYYQLLNQANYRMLHGLQEAIANASEVVRAKKNYILLFNRDSLFAAMPSLDETDAVMKEMDKNFDIENAGSPATPAKK